MFYKIKLTDDGIELLSKTRKKGKDKAGILYVTAEEFNRLNDKIVLDTTNSKKVV